MIRLALSGCCVLLFTLRPMAQTEFGTKAGLNYNIWISSEAESASGIGYHLGGYAHLRFSDLFGLQPELLFSQRGVKESTIETAVTTVGGVTNTIVTNKDTKISAGYVELPLLVVLSFGIVDVQAGPDLGFLVTWKQKFDSDIEQTTTGGAQPVVTNSHSSGSSTNTTGLNAFSLGVASGVSFNFGSRLSAGVRYMQGFSSLYDTSDGAPAVLQSEFQVSAGYSFIERGKNSKRGSGKKKKSRRH